MNNKQRKLLFPNILWISQQHQNHQTKTPIHLDVYLDQARLTHYCGHPNAAGCPPCFPPIPIRYRYKAVYDRRSLFNFRGTHDPDSTQCQGLVATSGFSRTLYRYRYLADPAGGRIRLLSAARSGCSPACGDAGPVAWQRELQQQSGDLLQGGRPQQYHGDVPYLSAGGRLCQRGQGHRRR